MILGFFAQNLVLIAACKTDAVFAALVCHAIRAPEDIALLLTHGLNVAYIIEFFGVKVTEGCTFFGVWLLAGLLGACVEKHMPVPAELESLVSSIGPRSFARALDKLEAAAVAGCTVTPLAFSLYFWHLLVAAVDNVFDESASKALAAAGTKFATGVPKRFADMLAETLQSREEQRKEQQAVALKKADALLEELMREEQGRGGAGKGKRSRRQRRAAKGEAVGGTTAEGAAAAVAAGAVAVAGTMRGTTAAHANDVQGIVYRRPYTPSPVVLMDYSPSLSDRLKRNAGGSPSHLRLHLADFSAEAKQFLLELMPPTMPRAQYKPPSGCLLALSGFPELRIAPEALVAFPGSWLEDFEARFMGVGVHSTSPFNPALDSESQKRFLIVEPQAAENADNCVQGMASDDSAQACTPACTGVVECAGCFDVIEEKKRVVFVPCGHVCMCFECASQLQTCPMCRASVDTVVKPYYC